MSWKDLFYLQKNDRRVLIIILLIIVIFSVLIVWIGRSVDNTKVFEDTGLITSKTTAEDKRAWNYATPSKKKELFPFDPNTADSTALLRLGLSPWQVRNIYRYRAKGGIYRQKADFAKIYGMTLKKYRELEPYIRISEDYQPAAEYVHSEPIDYPNRRVYEPTIHHSNKLHDGEFIALNTADTTALMRVPGIGTGYAHAIINLRERLGGFYSPKQVLEIEGVPESALKYMRASATEVKKLKINHMTVRQLRRHPYINFYQARVIFDYRRMNGPLTTLRQLSFSKDFPPAEIRRLEPYITYD